MYRFLIFLLFLFCSGSSSGQLFPSEVFPRNIFRNPLSIPIKLAANFGELRSNHYHMGLDIRTEHRENLPVYAAAEGYIYRIKIEPFGFGQAIYIRHAGGFITLYAHLNAFFPALAAWIKQKQYEMERWDLALDPPAGLFKVKKGELIAYSGNMGGSQGPHLHFEIRSFPEDINLNPLLFGLPVIDDIPPVIRSLSLYDRNRSFYEQQPFFIPVKGKSGRYTIARPELICKTPNPGFGIVGFDTQSGSNNPNGIYEGDIYDNGKEISGFQMNHISYNETNGINAHIDYPTHARGGPYYQLLFKMPGYKHSIYRESVPGGIIHLEDGQPHLIRLEIKDANGNISKLEFKARYQPDSGSHAEGSGKMFYPGMVDGLETNSAAFYLGENCLYDSLHLIEHESTGLGSDLVSDLHQFGNSSIPLADTITVRLKLNKLVDRKQKVLMRWSDKDDFEVKKPAWLDEWATANFRSFGTFSLVLDTVPPTIRIPGVMENTDLHRSSRIEVIVQDNYKKIKYFRATLDGNWLLFSNDKAKAYVYHFDEHCPPGKHELKIFAEDEAGNDNSLILHFTR
jgi:murein DD-endopeptidase MepM/ murein hydrolase activator NlpD